MSVWMGETACLHTFLILPYLWNCCESPRARSLASLRTWEEEHAEFNSREKRSDTMGFGITSEKILSCRLVVSTYLPYLSVILRSSSECMSKERRNDKKNLFFFSFSSDDYTEGGGKVAKLIKLQ